MQLSLNALGGKNIFAFPTEKPFEYARHAACLHKGNESFMAGLKATELQQRRAPDSFTQ